MSWKTSKGFVSSNSRIDRIEKEESIRGIVTNGAIARYMTRKDYPALSGITEGGFAVDIYLKKVSERMEIPGGINHDNLDINLEDRNRVKKINGVLKRGPGREYAGFINSLDNKDDDKKIINFWYNGNWNVFKIPLNENGAYIPIDLAREVIIGTGYSESIFSKKVLGTDDYESVNVKDMADKMGMSDLFSYWKMDGIQNYMLNTDMKDGPYFYKREDNKVSIIFNMEFENNTDKKDRQVSISNWVYGRYITAIKDGFNLWDTVKGNDGKPFVRGKGEVSNYGFENITVSVSITDDNNKKKNMVSIINSFDEDLYNQYISTRDEDIMQAPNVETKTWKINNIGNMTMYNFHTHPDYFTYGEVNYTVDAGHEFGHLLGLGDAYNKDLIETSETNEKDIMWDITKDSSVKVSFNDLEMVFIAALYNKKQEFARENVSPAITMQP